MTASDIQLAVALVIDTLDELGVRYHIGGSVASSLVGTPRTTIDVDLVADLRPVHVERFARALSEAYYVDADAVRDAVARRTSFNAIHLNTMMKVDVFVLKDTEYDRVAFDRMVQSKFDDSDNARSVWIASAEDTILNKLIWFRLGQEVSQRQWRDVMGVIQVHKDALDLG